MPRAGCWGGGSRRVSSPGLQLAPSSTASGGLGGGHGKMGELPLLKGCPPELEGEANSHGDGQRSPEHLQAPAAREEPHSAAGGRGNGREGSQWQSPGTPAPPPGSSLALAPGPTRHPLAPCPGKPAGGRPEARGRGQAGLRPRVPAVGVAAHRHQDQGLGKPSAKVCSPLESPPSHGNGFQRLLVCCREKGLLLPMTREGGGTRTSVPSLGYRRGRSPCRRRAEPRALSPVPGRPLGQWQASQRPGPGARWLAARSCLRDRLPAPTRPTRFRKAPRCGSLCAFSPLLRPL